MNYEFAIHMLPAMAEQAIASGSPGNNPQIPSIDEIVDLYQQVYWPTQSRIAVTQAVSGGGR